MPSPRRAVRSPALATAALVGVLLLASCSGDDGDGAGANTTTTGVEERAVRFCDAFLDYLGEPTPENLAVVVDSADDPAVTELAAIVGDDDRTGRVLAATDDLETAARDRCQAEWVGGAQGAGNAGAAAQAFVDALLAGDRLGARNVASANAIARFEPWEPIVPDPDLGTPQVVEADEGSFVVVLDADTLAECQVETGVILACTLADG